MKLLISMMLVMTVTSYAQKNNQGTINVKKIPANDLIYEVVDQMPVFSGGDPALINFIQKNLTYPQSAKENGRSGMVAVSFVIERNGSINDIMILKGMESCPECNLEALRVVRLMPAFNPGKKEGVPVRVKFYLPIRFVLK
jgi:periplasmic protein TonB